MIPTTTPARSGPWNWYRLRCALGLCPMRVEFIAAVRTMVCATCKEIRT
jgi:hypothetical protein